MKCISLIKKSLPFTIKLDSELINKPNENENDKKQSERTLSFHGKNK